MADSRFVYVTYIRTTPEKLWRALIEPELTQKFFMECRQESDWVKGSSWKNVAPTGLVTDSGEVLEIEPFRRLVLSWRNEFVPDMHQEGYSRLSYDLEPVGESVKLTLIHEIALADSKLIEGVSGGWPLLMSSLKSMLETGDSLAESRKWAA